jgi:hypothetical protein
MGENRTTTSRDGAHILPNPSERRTTVLKMRELPARFFFGWSDHSGMDFSLIYASPQYRRSVDLTLPKIRFMEAEAF